LVNQFTAAGAAPGKPNRYAALLTSRFFSGLWTVRSPLRDGATPFLYESYNIRRNDTLIDGLNTEITNRLTLARRPGLSVYNNQTFPAINSFYSFHTFSETNTIRVIADTASAVYDATGPSTKLLLLNKDTGAGQTYFQSVGNTLFFGDGVDLKKWVRSSKTWQANTRFGKGSFIVDSNNNLQVSSGGLSANISSVTVSSSHLVVALKDACPFTAGQRVALSGLTTATFLNDQTVTISSVPAVNQFTATFTHSDYATANDTGSVSNGTGITESTQPAWQTTPGSVTVDGGVQWICKGSSIQKWGISAPSLAPTAANAVAQSQYSSWAADTIYSPSLSVIDGNNNVQILTTAGTTGSSEPSWNTSVGGTTTDGTAVWTNNGTANWQANSSYDVGDTISVVFSVTTSYIQYDAYGHSQTIYESYSVSAVFKCITAGSSGTYQPDWVNGTGLTVADGTAVWQNIGLPKTWSSVGASTKVNLASVIVDSNGNKQYATSTGKSGSTEPTWSSTVGKSTTDGGVTWSCQGPFSAEGTASYYYAFAFKNSVTGHVSTASPLSLPITRAASSVINIQGDGSSDPQVDSIEIYRTAQGGSALLYLAEIPNSGTGSRWSFSDTIPDANLNELIQAQISNSNDPPPDGAIVPAYHQGRVWVAVKNYVYASGGPDTTNGSGNEAFPPANVFTFPSQVVRLQPYAQGLLVFTVSDTYVILGQGAITNFYAVPFLKGYGLLSYNALDTNGSVFYMMTSDNQCLSLDPSSGVSDVGLRIGDILASWNPASVYMAWHAAGSLDKAIYVSDGSTGWYRMNPTPAPETDISWSPKAGITGGCKAVQSIEVTPGHHHLLVSPASSGQILYRDTNVFTDNGTPYPAYATMGSILLASHGQTAAVSFVGVDCPKTGSAPTIGLRLNEVSGAFDSLRDFVQDPTDLPPSDSLYGLRYYVSQTGKHAICRHLQIKVSWPAEDSASELYSYALYGCLLKEG
jgi:hypothetical protein